MFSFKNQAVPTQQIFDFLGTTTSGGGHRARSRACACIPIRRDAPISTNISSAANAATTATAFRNENNTDISTHGPIRRLFYLSTSVKF